MLELKSVGIDLSSHHFDFTLTVHPGEIVVILGASGSGKSTLLNLVGGFLSAQRGDITWQGQSLLNLMPDERPVTTLFQKHNLFEHLPVWKNIALGVDPGAKLDSVQQVRLQEALLSVGLPGYEKRMPSTLSGGEQQRVALARCLMSQKPVLLLDEPYSALDQDRRLQTLELTRSIVESESLCTLLVSHDPRDAEVLQARVVRIIDDRLSEVQGKQQP